MASGSSMASFGKYRSGEALQNYGKGVSYADKADNFNGLITLLANRTDYQQGQSDPPAAHQGKTVIVMDMKTVYKQQYII